MSPELALQFVVRQRLAETSGVTDLVPASSILDRNARPTPTPSIIIGEGQSIDEGDSIARNLLQVYLDLHVWMTEDSTEGVKLIAGAIRRAIQLGRLANTSGFHFVDCHVRSSRYLRDPDGLTSHAVVTISAKVQEIE